MLVDTPYLSGDKVFSTMKNRLPKGGDFLKLNCKSILKTFEANFQKNKEHSREKRIFDTFFKNVHNFENKIETLIKHAAQKVDAGNVTDHEKPYSGLHFLRW